MKHSPETVEAAAALAESLANQYAVQNNDILPLFAAFVGLVFSRDSKVGRDCLIALDRYVSASVEKPGRAA